MTWYGMFELLRKNQLSYTRDAIPRPLTATTDHFERHRHRWSVMPDGRGHRQSSYTLGLSVAKDTRVRRDFTESMGALTTAECA